MKDYIVRFRGISFVASGKDERDALRRSGVFTGEVYPIYDCSGTDEKSVYIYSVKMSDACFREIIVIKEV